MTNETTTELKTFNIPEWRFSAFQKDFSRLVRRASKLGVAEPSFEVVKRWVKPAVISEDGAVLEPSRDFVTVKVFGAAPKLAGWRFLAVIEHSDEGNLVRKVPSAEAPVRLDVRANAATCEHCKTNRKRVETFIVQKIETGEQKQVGRQCIADFLGGESPESIARWAELVAAFDFDEYEESEGGYGQTNNREFRASLAEFLAWTVKIVNESGWLSRTEARDRGSLFLATADLSWSALTATDGTVTRADFGYLTDADRAAGHELVEWIEKYFESLDQSKFDENEYLYNVRLIVDAGDVRFRTAGLAASIIRIRDKVLGDETHYGRRRSQDPQYVGEIGKRSVFRNLVVYKISDFENAFGASHLHLFLDEQGNILKWVTGTTRLGIGRSYNVKGTVKEHKDYKGIKQTTLSRCALVDEKGKALPEAEYK